MNNSDVFLGKIQSQISRDDEYELSTAASGNTSGTGSGSENEMEAPKRLGKGQPMSAALLCLMGAVDCARRAASPDKAGSVASTEAPSSPATTLSSPSASPTAQTVELEPAKASKAKRSRKKSSPTVQQQATTPPIALPTTPSAAAAAAALTNAPWRRKAFAGLQGGSSQVSTSCPAPPPGLVQQDFCSAAAPGSLLPQGGLLAAAVPAGFRPPPGLELPAAVAPPMAVPPAVAPVAPVVFTNAMFRKELVAILKDLDQNRSAVAAVKRVRALQVPVSRQAAEFADILTRAVEEPRGMMRRPILAFAVGLAAGQPSAFERSECAAGVNIFFSEVYPELCDEVPRLSKIATSELVPMLRSVFGAEELKPFIPEALLDELQM